MVNTADCPNLFRYSTLSQPADKPGAIFIVMRGQSLEFEKTH